MQIRIAEVDGMRQFTRIITASFEAKYLIPRGNRHSV